MRSIDTVCAFLKPVPPYALPRPEDPIPEGWTRVSDKGAPYGLIDMSPEFVAGQREMELRYARELPAAGPWIAVTAGPPSHSNDCFVWVGGPVTGEPTIANFDEGSWFNGAGDVVDGVTHYAEIRRPE